MSDQAADPLSKPFDDAFSTKLSEIARVKYPSDLLVVGSTVFVSSFLSDSVLQTTLPLSQTTQFRVFAHGSYCTPRLRRCAILNGPWGLAHTMGRLFVSSFGSDQILVFEASSGRFIDAFGDSGSLDSPEGLALNRDATILYAASFLDSRIVAFDLPDIWSQYGEEGRYDSDGAVIGLQETFAFGPVSTGRTIATGLPVDLDYLVSDGNGNDYGMESAGISPLHGPENIVVLLPSARGYGSSRERLAVTSYYNSSVVILDAADGTLLEVVTGPPGTLDYPVGIAVDDDCVAKRGDCLLVTTYKNAQRKHGQSGGGNAGTSGASGFEEMAEGSVSRFVDDGTHGWHFDGIALSAPLLRGPSAVTVLPDGSALVCAYDGSALLLFNATEAGLERKYIASVAGSLANKELFYESGPYSSGISRRNPGRDASLSVGAGRKRTSKKKSQKKRRLQQEPS